MEKIKPHHLFHHEGCYYVINIEGMFAGIIDETAAGVLEMISADSTAPLDPLIEEELKKLGLRGQASGAKREAKKEPTSVINMCLFLTQSCNLKCVYCYGDGGTYGTGGNMEEKTALQAVDWLIEQSGKMKKIHIGFFGGEPFLMFPLMKAVVEYAKKRAQELEKEVDFHATTNATLLDDEKISFIKEQPVSVMVSFDGPKEVQDAQRPYANGKGSYDSILPKIKKLLAAVPETPGHAVIIGNTDPSLVKEALQEIGFAEIIVMPASRSLFSGDPDKIGSARNTHNLLQELEQEAKTWIRLTQSRDVKALKSLMVSSELYPGMISLFHNSKRYHACGAGLGLVAVSALGDIYLCHRFVGMDEYRLGSVFGKDLTREEYQKSPTTGSTVCSNCFARYYCAGGCKHDNVGSCGSIAAPAKDMCRLRCRELELAAYIICSLKHEDKAFLIEQEVFPPKPCPFDF